MKKRLVIFNSFLALAVLFAMLFQSVHSYEHVIQQLSEKKCHHSYSSKHEITHQHHNLDHCYVCDLKTSNFIYSDIQVFGFQEAFVCSGKLFSNNKGITEFFKGSLFTLRAPPFFIA